MLPDDLQPLVSGLLEKARRNEVNWLAAADLDMGSGDSDVVVSFPDYAVNIYASETEHGEALIAFSLINARGQRIHGFSSEEGESGYSELSELLALARKRILGVDDALVSLQRLLEQPGTIGSKAPLRTQRADDLPF